MRRCSSLCSVLLGGGTFALLAVACGHEIPRGGGGQSSATKGGSSSTDTNAGGSGNTGNESTGGTPISNTDSNACPTDVTLKKDIARPGYTAKRDSGVDELLKSMDRPERLKQLYGIPTPPWNNGYGDVYNDIERSEDADSGSGSKKVRGYRYRDAGRGVNLAAGQDNRKSQGKDYSTTFPAPSIRAASWDMELEARVGEAMGDEVIATKNNMLLAPCMNIIRHPYWGRTQETYSEDMYHTGRMASAFTAGLQKRVVGCAKHFAANNIENGRDFQNAEMDEQTLREVYSEHFDMVVREGGVGCIMASYNLINEKKSTQNKHLLTEILRTPVDKGGMGYRGLVISDWWAMPGSQNGPGRDSSAISTAQEMALEAFQAGLDIEVPWALYYGQLSTLAEQGKITDEQINVAAGRVLEQKFRFGSVWGDGNSNDPWGLEPVRTKLEGDSLTNNDEHLALAEESARKSAVLLKNGTGDQKVLPIKSSDVKSIAVVGLEVTVTVHAETTLPVTGDKLNFATTINVGDRGSSRVNPDPDKSIPPHQGIKSIADNHGITNVTTGTTAESAKDADFVVVVVGLTAGNEGEEYSIANRDDRKTLELPNDQAAFVNEVLDLQKPTAILIESGSIVNVPWIKHSNKKQATIWAGYPGQHAGIALGKLLLGDANFAGRMPLAWPEEDQLLKFRDGKDFNAKMGYFHGYREFDMRKSEGKDVKMIFPFGHGLSYTEFKIDNLKLPCGSIMKDGVLNFTVDVANTGSMEGAETVMVFVKGPKSPSRESGKARPVKVLKGFEHVVLKPSGEEGDKKTIELQLPIQSLRHWDGDQNGSWVIDEGEYTIMVGGNADDPALETNKGTIKVKG